ncbi:MAG: hypothetical protein KDB23_32390, partial [Planctomycetales bacterium]|nr:hypothetical protein [Planctomycetales bacterium]
MVTLAPPKFKILPVFVVYSVLNVSGVECRQHVPEFAVQRAGSDGEKEYLDGDGQWHSEVHAVRHSRTIAEAYER